MIDELRHRDPLLFWIGALMVLALIVVTLLSIGDTRLILGLNPWVKPMKFLTSITIFLWTVAWFMPETQASTVGSGFSRIDKRRIVRWTIGPAMLLEIVCIILQSARGTSSHFNNTSPLDAIIFGVMGVTIALNTIAMVIFLAILRRDTPPNRAGYIWGIRAGVAIFLLASLQGGLIVGNNAHTVGAPDGGPGLPFVNWSTSAGDLRIAHFFGMHALQVLPLLGFVLDRLLSRGNRPFLSAEAPGAKVEGFSPAAARNVVIAASVLWVTIMGGMLLIALDGRPLWTL